MMNNFLTIVQSYFLPKTGSLHITETLVISFLKEILKEKKLQIEKEAFKRKIVWLKK